MTESPAASQPTAQQSGLDRFLRLFSDVRAGEATTALLMLANLLFLLIAYYVLKVVREPLILSTPGGAELKSYGAAGQAVVLMAFVPFYSWFCSRVDRVNLILSVGVFFIVCIEIFSLGASLEIPYLGIAFFIWVGIFSLSVIAQFWSFANDLYSKDEGARLFPIIAIGATAGSPIGSKVAGWLFGSGMSPSVIMQVAAVLLAGHVGLSLLVNSRESARRSPPKAVSQGQASGGGFALVFRSRYLLLMAALFLFLNIVNTTGEYIVSSKVVEAAKEAGQDTKAFIGGFYGDYFFWVNIAALVMQSFLVSRIVKFTGIAGVVLMLPIISFCAYSVIAAGAGLALIRWAKTAENSTDYSVMNTARAMLWLPTSREEKYKAKQAIDTFFVRFGDVLAGGVVFIGTELVRLGPSGFATANLCLIAVWVAIAVLLLKEHKKLAPAESTDAGRAAA